MVALVFPGVVIMSGTSDNDDVAISGGNTGALRCGHAVPLAEWHKWLGDQFNGAGGLRKKPLIALTCPRCKYGVSVDAFRALADADTLKRFEAMLVRIVA